MDGLVIEKGAHCWFIPWLTPSPKPAYVKGRQFQPGEGLGHGRGHNWHIQALPSGGSFYALQLCLAWGWAISFQTNAAASRTPVL